MNAVNEHEMMPGGSRSDTPWYRNCGNALKLSRLHLYLNEQPRTVILGVLRISARCNVLCSLGEALEGLRICCNRMGNELEID
jgi:hypothetical protein